MVILHILFSMLFAALTPPMSGPINPHSSVLYAQPGAKANAMVNYKPWRAGHLLVIFYCECPTLFLIILVQTTLCSSDCNSPRPPHLWIKSTMIKKKIIIMCFICECNCMRRIQAYPGPRLSLSWTFQMCRKGTKQNWNGGPGPSTWRLSVNSNEGANYLWSYIVPIGAISAT